MFETAVRFHQNSLLLAIGSPDHRFRSVRQFRQSYQFGSKYAGHWHRKLQNPEEPFPPTPPETDPPICREGLSQNDRSVQDKPPSRVLCCWLPPEMEQGSHSHKSIEAAPE